MRIYKEQKNRYLIFDIDVSIDDEVLYDELVKRSGGNTRLICFKCIDKATKNYIKEMNMERAVAELAAFITVRDYKFTMELMVKEVSDYGRWRKECVDSDRMTMKILADESNNNTIYSLLSAGASLNLLARLWHDEYHYTYDLSFSLKDELEVQEMQFKELENSMLSTGSKLVFVLDMVGQSLGYSFTGKFVGNQLEYVKALYMAYTEVYGVSVFEDWDDMVNAVEKIVHKVLR